MLHAVVNLVQLKYNLFWRPVWMNGLIDLTTYPVLWPEAQLHKLCQEQAEALRLPADGYTADDLCVALGSLRHAQTSAFSSQELSPCHLVRNTQCLWVGFASQVYENTVSPRATAFTVNFSELSQCYTKRCFWGCWSGNLLNTVTLYQRKGCIFKMGHTENYLK